MKDLLMKSRKTCLKACDNFKFKGYLVKLVDFENILEKLNLGCILYMSMLKTCSLFSQNLGCVLYTSVSYTRDGAVCSCHVHATNREIKHDVFFHARWIRVVST